ncbi:MAG TPA: phosphate signaling complex protein PhoU [Longimicrobiales bacterium]|nr:phosphate signaling complex protein PhoU [Longimicrobiales bacterium]
MTPQRHFQEGLDDLKVRPVEMAGLAEEAVQLAVEALLTRDRAKADRAIELDSAIDDLELQVDDAAIQLLALQQPLARDLRFITMAMKISHEVERIGDHAVNIAQNVTFLLEAPPFPPLPEIEEMTRLARAMLRDALDAFIRGDSQLARDIGRRDDRVDDLHRNVFRILLMLMLEEPRRITAGMDMLLVSRNRERIADLATNIAEEVVYLVEGRTIKHGGDRRPAGDGAPGGTAEPDGETAPPAEGPPGNA